MRFLILIAIFHTIALSNRKAEAIKCLACRGIAEPEFCQQVDHCADGEVCGIEKVITSVGSVKYNLECTTSAKCSQQRQNRNKRVDSSGTVQLCNECCHGDLCNSGGCGQPTFQELGKKVCYNCDYISDPSSCRDVEVCDENEICFIQESETFLHRVYTSSCNKKRLCDALTKGPDFIGRRRRDIRKKRETMCIQCCTDSLCNNRCPKDSATTQGIRSSTTTTATTTTKKPTTVIDTTTEVSQSTIEQTTKQKTCPAGWLQFQTFCYHMESTSKSWADAQTSCENQNSGLAAVDSSEKNAFLSSHAKTYDYWVGGNDKGTEGVWRWITTGNKINNFEKWYPGDPDGSTNQNCMVFNYQSSSKWIDAPCNTKYKFICEKSTS